ncbi:MAG: hypothetical protein KOO62_01565 [candidate division Zixibacteria bacterium]|nr:hypothetical protein [candidate division Zixibacteria bacterium]
MIDDKIVELMNKVIDGSGSADDKEDLEKHLAENAEVRKYYDDLKATVCILDQVGAVEPPSNLKSNVMHSVRQHYQTNSREESSPRQTIVEIVRSVLNPRYGLSFAAGAAAALLVFSLWTGSSLEGMKMDPSHLAGTLMLDGISEGLVALDRDAFDLDGVSGSIESRVTGKALLIDIKALAVRPNEIILEFDPEQYRFDGFRQHDNPESQIAVKSGLVTMNLVAQHQYTLIFEVLVDEPTETMNCRVCSEGLMYEEQLETRAQQKKNK